MKWKRLLVKSITTEPNKTVTIELTDERRFTLPPSQIKIKTMNGTDMMAEIEVPFYFWKSLGFEEEAEKIEPKQVIVPSHLKCESSDLSFKTEPMPHQSQAYQKFAELLACASFMDMGTGKSKVSIDIAASRFSVGMIDKMFVICPVTTKKNFAKQVQTHCPVDFNIYVFDDKTYPVTIPTAEAGKLNIYICGSESLSHGGKGNRFFLSADKVIDDRTFLVIDESHMFKTKNANRTGLAMILACKAHSRMVMTGTPMSESVKDLYSQYNILSEDIIGERRLATFEKKYVIFDEFGRASGSKNYDALMARLEPYTFSCKKEDVLLDMPDRTYEVRTVQMTKEQLEIYESARNMILSDVHFNKNSELDLFKLFLILQQIICGYYNSKFTSEEDEEIIKFLKPDKNPKIIELLNVTEQLKGKQIVIFGKFRQELADIIGALKSKYGAESVSAYYGDVPQKEREENLSKFILGQTQFFVTNAATGGFGLNGLETAQYCIYMSNTFKYNERQQSEARLHRVGQKNSVHYIDIIMEKPSGANTIDHWIMKSIERKKNLVEVFDEELEKA